MRRDLGETGKAIWDACEADKLDAVQRALILEYARCADTADRLAALADGRRESWASLVFDDMGEVHLQIDKILDQVNKNQGMLKQLHGELRQSGIKVGNGSTKADKDEGPVDVLGKRRQEKERRERQSG
jgi:hypothetical protein